MQAAVPPESIIMGRGRLLGEYLFCMTYEDNQKQNRSQKRWRESYRKGEKIKKEAKIKDKILFDQYLFHIKQSKISMNNISFPQPRKPTLSPKQPHKKHKKNHINLDKKSHQATISTLCSKNSTQLRLKKFQQVKAKPLGRKYKPDKKKHPKKAVTFSELPLTLIENSENRFFSEQPEDFISFREYYMLEGKWIPLISQTQKENLADLCSKKEIIEEHKQLTKREEEDSESKKQAGTFSLQLPLSLDESFDEENKKNSIQQIEEIFSKLQFYYLPNEQIFNKIPHHLKEHYSQLLSSIMKKMVHIEEICSERSKKNDDLSPVKQLETDDSECREMMEEKKQNDKIYMAECKKLGMIFDEWSVKKGGVETNLRNIILIAQSIFEIIKTSFSDKIISNLKVAYGYDKLNKLSRVIRNQTLECELEVIPHELFKLLEDQNEDSTIYSQIHNSCIFDVINTQLQKFKPYYESNGQCFPWSLRMCPSITFYEINQHSLDIVLMEGKKKIIEDSSMLCGLMVDKLTEQQQIQLSIRRIQREDIMFRKFLQQQEYKTKEEVELELQSTLVLVHLSVKIEKILLMEVTAQMFGI